VFALIYLVVIVVEVLVVGLGAGAIMAAAPMEDLVRLLQTNPLELFAKVNPAVWLLIAVAWSAFGAGFVTVIAATCAQIYKDLRGPDHTDVFS